MALKGSHISQVFGEKRIIQVRALKNQRLPTQLIILPEFLGKNIMNCPPSKLFLLTSLPDDSAQSLWLISYI